MGLCRRRETSNGANNIHGLYSVSEKLAFYAMFHTKYCQIVDIKMIVLQFVRLLFEISKCKRVDIFSEDLDIKISLKSLQ